MKNKTWLITHIQMKINSVKKCFPHMHGSVLDILHLYAEDPEETLFELGFGYDEPQFNIRIPSRFFTFPSQAKGINFRGFLESQLQRIRDEDPSLTLASKTYFKITLLKRLQGVAHDLFLGVFQVVSGRCRCSQRWPTLSTHSTLTCRALRYKNWPRQSLRSTPLLWRGWNASEAPSAASRALRLRG